MAKNLIQRVMVKELAMTRSNISEILSKFQSTGWSPSKDVAKDNRETDQDDKQASDRKTERQVI